MKMKLEMKKNSSVLKTTEPKPDHISAEVWSGEWDEEAETYAVNEHFLYICGSECNHKKEEINDGNNY